jgi:signal transduction histidine kinase
VHRLRGEIEDIVNYISMPRVVVSETDQGFNFTAFEAAVCAICANLGLEPATITGLSSLTGDSRLTISQNTLEIILRELLENSKKFHPDNNPEINLLVQPNPPQSIRIRAADNGVHLSPEQLALAWTPYYQGEKYFTGEAKGMGLGLPMVASLVWSVGGKCRLYNRDDGPGVVVELDLPVLSN